MDKQALSLDLDAHRFEILLPWYVNGTLDSADRAWIDAYLNAKPELYKEVRWLEALQQNLRTTASAPSADIGLSKALTRIRADRGRSKGWRSRSGWAAYFYNPRLGAGLAAAAACVMLGQSALIFHYRQAAELARGVDVRTAPISQASSMVIRVNFDADAREEQIRLALASVDARIVSGPGRIGDYYVVTDQPTESALAQLRRHQVVTSAVGVQRVPPRD